MSKSGSGGRHRPNIVSLLMAVALVCGGGVDAAVAQPAPPVPVPPPGTYQPPVFAPVIDGFRPPARPWEAGNRGLEYGTVPGQPVVVAGAGRVVFAGQVGGTLHVTVLHPDGIRTSYSFLAEILVTTGQPVSRGDFVGRASARFHVGVRIVDEYIDPALLWGDGAPHVFLVPLDGAGAPGGDGTELRALLEVGWTDQPPIRDLAVAAADFAAASGPPLA